MKKIEPDKAFYSKLRSCIHDYNGKVRIRKSARWVPANSTLEGRGSLMNRNCRGKIDLLFARSHEADLRVMKDRKAGLASINIIKMPVLR